MVKLLLKVFNLNEMNYFHSVTIDPTHWKEMKFKIFYRLASIYSYLNKISMVPVNYKRQKLLSLGKDYK